MKTWKKVVLIISSIVLGISLLIGGGYLYMEHKYQQEQEYMEKVVYSDEAKGVYEEVLKEVDSKVFTKEGVIHSYVIDKSTIKHNPMGGISVVLIVNHDKSLYVQVLLEKSQNKLDIGSYSYSPELDQLIGEEK